MVSSAPFTFGYTRTALRQLRKCPKREQIINLLETISGDPFRIDDSINSLKGNADSFRRRFGDWRVCWQIDATSRAIMVFEIAARVGAEK